MFSHGPDLFRATRLRLALWYTLVTAILLVIFASGVYIYVRGTLVERIDDTLKHVVEVVERSLVIESISPTAGRYRVNVESSFRDRAVTHEDDRIELEWFDHSGDLVWSTFSEPPTNPIHLARTGETVHLSDDYLLRQVTKRLEV
ncbi:MAG: sensor histidine kinase, partial [Cyanobacteria bacterium P01_H01_bin.15]